MADEVAILRREIVPLVGSPDRLGFDILRGKMLIASGTPVITMDGHTEAELLTSMGALEAHSDHPLARAIVTHVRERGVTITPAEDVQAVQHGSVVVR